MNDARHYPDVGVAVVENVVDEGGRVAGACWKGEGETGERMPFSTVKHFQMAHKALLHQCQQPQCHSTDRNSTNLRDYILHPVGVDVEQAGGGVQTGVDLS